MYRVSIMDGENVLHSFNVESLEFIKIIKLEEAEEVANNWQNYGRVPQTEKTSFAVRSQGGLP
jgi:hypothetical protein